VRFFACGQSGPDSKVTYPFRQAFHRQDTGGCG
jgi:hypothetical protein